VEVGTGFALMLVVVRIKLRRAITAGMDKQLGREIVGVEYPYGYKKEYLRSCRC
jgi:hypothetical protein